MLGHAELTTTQIYTQVSIRRLQAVHSATHSAEREEASWPGLSKTTGDSTPDATTTHDATEVSREQLADETRAELSDSDPPRWSGN
jgi:integrase/recombinase XerD